MKVVISEFINGEDVYSIGSVEECLKVAWVFDEEHNKHIDAQKGLLEKVQATALAQGSSGRWEEHEGWLFREDELAGFNPKRGFFGGAHIGLEDELPFTVPAKPYRGGGYFYFKK